LTIPPATTSRAANIIGLGYLWTNTDDKDGVNSESVRPLSFVKNAFYAYL